MTVHITEMILNNLNFCYAIYFCIQIFFACKFSWSLVAVGRDWCFGMMCYHEQGHQCFSAYTIANAAVADNCIVHVEAVLCFLCFICMRMECTLEIIPLCVCVIQTFVQTRIPFRIFFNV